MFHTITNVLTVEPVSLQQYIDNRGDNLQISLRSITYKVGWYNVKSSNESFSWLGEDGTKNTMIIPPGLYSFAQLKNLIETGNPKVLVDQNKMTGLLNLAVASGEKIWLTDGLLSLLGLDDGLGGQLLNGGIYTGDYPMNFLRTSNLHVYLDQISTTANFVDGAPSTLLATVGLSRHSFGDVFTSRIIHPEFKKLQSGTINELKVTVRDDKGSIVDSINFPISVTLEII